MTVEAGWTFEVDFGSEGERLDVYLSKRIPRLSRARTARLVVVDLDDPARGPLKKSLLVRAGQRLFARRPVPDAGVVRSVMRTPRLYDGTIAKVPGVVTARVREVTIEMIERTAWLDLDGEAPGKGPVTFRVYAGRLRLAGAPK